MPSSADGHGRAARAEEPSPEVARLFQLARALGRALTGGEVATALFDHVMAQLGASTVGLWLLGDDGVVHFGGGVGHSSDHGPESVGPIPLDSDLPAAVALRRGEIVSYGSVAERNERWPELTGITGFSEAVVVVPLMARERVLGCLAIGWSEADESFEPDQELAWAVADLGATALDRARLFEGERTARETLEFLAQGTRIMASALDPAEVVRSLVDLAVPRLAPWCAVYVARDNHLVRVAIEISTNPELADQLRNSGPISVDADVPLARVYRTGQAMYMDEVPAEVVKRTYQPDQVGPVIELTGGHTAALVLPVQASGRVLGVMSLLSPEWRSLPPPQVRHSAEGLAAWAGVALDNARRYHEQVDNVRLLTAALMPERVPQVEGWSFAARYVPASGGVCGDWYEVELLPDGQLRLGIGDASGHGLAAAATMARIRHAARGLAAAGIPPARMFEYLSGLLAEGPGDSIATALCGRIDLRTGSGRWVSAGHPPLILVNPAGAGRTVAPVSLPPGPPIGAPGHYVEASLELAPGGRLILYTDGTFERRGEDPEVGISRLVELITAMAGASEDDLADAVIRGRGAEDDACVLVVGRGDA